MSNLERYYNDDDCILFEDLREIEKAIVVKRELKKAMKNNEKIIEVTKEEFNVILNKFSLFNKYIKNSFKVAYCDLIEDNIIIIELKEL